VSRPANESVTAEDPKVSRPAHSRSVTLTGRDPVFGGRAFARFVEDDFGLGKRKSGECDVKIEVDKTLKLVGEHRAVQPAFCANLLSARM
jgi:hypothetical protein